MKTKNGKEKYQMVSSTANESLSRQSQRVGKEEKEHLDEVCDSFRQYATFTRCARAGQAARIAELPPSQRIFLPRSLIFGNTEAKTREETMQEAELKNQFFFDSMLKHAGLPHSQDVVPSSNKNNASGSEKVNITNDRSKGVAWSSDQTIDKVHSVLKSLARDWSKEAAAERAMSYAPILDGLKRHVPLSDKMPTRILVPGAGVGRLALEIYSLGYEVQGNEFSLHMLLASDFVLNGCSTNKPYAISPWITSTRNVCRADDPSRKVLIPDIDPASAMAINNDAFQPDFSMAAGEFVSIYNKLEQHGKWKAIVSCFFLDTASCIVEYLKVMWDILDDDGVLVNIGPLHYHWQGPPFRPDDVSFSNYKIKNKHLDKRYLQSVDMTWEDVREVLWRIGFEVLEERLGVKARYTADSRNFLNSDYRCISFIARKGTPHPQSISDK